MLGLYLPYLNAGGNPILLERAFDPIVDVTGDGVPELFIQADEFHVLSCSEGEYVQLLFLPDQGFSQGPRLEFLEDANTNGIPELVVSVIRGRRTHIYDVFEWSSEGFHSLVVPPSGLPFKPETLYSSPSSFSPEPMVAFRDTDTDGVKELVSYVGLPFWDVCANYPPWREEWDFFEIDSAGNYVGDSVAYSLPEYRFQAVQDGDRLTLYGDYDTALRLYQDAVFSDKLDWWSEARQEFICTEGFDQGPISPSDIHAARLKSSLALDPDPAEYPTIAAYARFRIMLLHILRGWLPEAEIVYSTLLEKYPGGSEGSEVVAMATAFMDKYRATADIELSCEAAIQRVRPQSDSLLGYVSGGGDQAEPYEPALLCPFGPLVPIPSPSTPR